MNPTVTVAAGAVEGRRISGTDRFLGIPYAAPPVGQRRFLAPVPPESWDGVRQADAFGPTVPQRVGIPSGGLPAVIEPTVDGDDWLNLNVWTPADRDAPLPVLVWIHGGGFFEGSSANRWYDGASFARQGVVFVSINYRYGAEGFLELEGAPSNRGILDCIAALQWVREEISAFGGDPGNVTVMGQSAGGMAVSALLGAPSARGLFRRAIIASGVSDISAWSRETATRVADAITAELGIPRHRDAAAALPPDAFVEAHAVVSANTADGEVIALPWAPFVDGVEVRGTIFDTVAAGDGNDIPLMIGSTANEFAWMAYRHSPDDQDARDAGQRMYADAFFRLPIHRLAEARLAAAAPTYRYEFQWHSTAAPFIRAGHSLDIPFFFHNLDAPFFADYAGEHPPEALADAMHGAFAAFARDGDPGWAPYAAGRTVMIFDDPTREGAIDDLALPAT